MRDIYSIDVYKEILFEEAPIGIARVNKEGRILRANKLLREKLGYTNQELQQITFDKFTDPKDIKSDMFEFNRMVAGDIDYYYMEKRYITKQGKMFWAMLHVYAVRIDGHLEEILGYVDPLPNGGHFVVNKDEDTGKVIVRPTMTIKQLYKDNRKTLNAFIIGVIGTLVTSVIIVAKYLSQ